MPIARSTTQRAAFRDAMLSANSGEWPDLEGLVAAVYKSYLQPGDLAMDVGVNRGVHLIGMAERVGPRGRVIGVEAVPEFAERIRERLRGDLAHLAERITLHNFAVSAEEGTASFFVTEITDGGLSGLRLRPVISDMPYKQISVPVKRIDTLLHFWDKVRFAKIDIEGAEYDALRGARKLLQKKPLIAFEFDPSAPEQFGYQVDELMRLLRDADYGVYDIFGFEVADGAAMMGAVVWNFLAVPKGQDSLAVTAPVQTALQSRFPSLAGLGPN